MPRLISIINAGTNLKNNKFFSYSVDGDGILTVGAGPLILKTDMALLLHAALVLGFN